MTLDTNRAQTLQPLAVARDAGEALWWLGDLAVIKVTAADTDGTMAIVEVLARPGEAPRHVHHREDEGFWILEGDVTFTVGDSTVAARAGDYVFAPRDIPHGYMVGERGCRMLFILTPAGMEDLVRDLSEPALSRTLPPPPEGEPDLERIVALCKAYGVELAE